MTLVDAIVLSALRRVSWGYLSLTLAANAIAFAATQPEAAFQDEIRPMLKQYCLVCHSAALHTGDVNLEQFTSYQDVLKRPHLWQKAVEQLSLGEMPPKAMPQPSQEQRAQLVAWANRALTVAAKAHAGDPGPVVLRRLNNAEYTYTVRDLTGVHRSIRRRNFRSMVRRAKAS